MTTIADKCREAGIAVPTYYFRIKQGMTPDEALSRGLLRRGRKKRQKSDTVAICEKYVVFEGDFQERLKRNRQNKNKGCSGKTVGCVVDKREIKSRKSYVEEVRERYGYRVVSTDLIDRGYFDRLPGAVDFLLENTRMDNIVTNPPFSLSYEFIEQGLRLARKELALLLPLRYLAGKARCQLYQRYPPLKIIVIPQKIDFVGTGNPVMEFAWFVWNLGTVARTEIVWAGIEAVKR